MGFIIHFYIIFGTNLLTQGPVQIVVFFLFPCFPEKENQMDSKRNETFGSVIFGTNVIHRTWSATQEAIEEATGWRARPLLGAPPISWAPRASTDLLIPPIYTHVPWEQQRRPRKTISTTVTFCIREIPSWSLRRRFAGGGMNHRGLLHQHHSLSDELWVVYHRPSGP